MKQYYDNHLIENYPRVYEDYETGDSVTDFGDGWFRLCCKISRLCRKKGSKIISLESINGMLRIVFKGRRNTDISDIARDMSTTICEECGTTEGVRKFPKEETHGMTETRSLCEQCGYSWRGIPDKIDIWKIYNHKCPRCERSGEVVYPKGVGGYHGGSWECVGEELSKKDYCNVQRSISHKQEMVVWGNHCEYCEKYLGNFYVFNHAMMIENEKLDEDESNEFDVIDTIEI